MVLFLLISVTRCGALSSAGRRVRGSALTHPTLMVMRAVDQFGDILSRLPEVIEVSAPSRC
ncbi:hypothetical protein [Streptomyces scabiei]|uniref:hypothetical protein n=1 Tax=Streptomyces scabiei TaxID=1930 RepID=UPI000A37B6E9|nr:hypothetical protein [Streptomyces scabiei]